MTQNPHVPTLAPLMDGLPVVVWPYGHFAAPASPCPEWQLLIGVLVEIRRHGLFLGIGLVDNATPLGDIAWIAADGNNDRSMIEKAGGYELSIENRITRNHSGTPLHPVDGNGIAMGPTSEDGLWTGQFTSSAWEGWWWGDPADESATDS